MMSKQGDLQGTKKPVSKEVGTSQKLKWTKIYSYLKHPI